MHEVKRELAEMIRLKTGLTPQAGDTLASLRIDSLAMAELTLEIEKRFQIKVGEDVLDVHTVDELVDYIASKCTCP